jgi:hypothetical protein
VIFVICTPASLKAKLYFLRLNPALKLDANNNNNNNNSDIIIIIEFLFIYPGI